MSYSISTAFVITWILLSLGFPAAGFANGDPVPGAPTAPEQPVVRRGFHYNDDPEHSETAPLLGSTSRPTSDSLNDGGYDYERRENLDWIDSSSLLSLKIIDWSDTVYKACLGARAKKQDAVRRLQLDTAAYFHSQQLSPELKIVLDKLRAELEQEDPSNPALKDEQSLVRKAAVLSLLDDDNTF